MFADQARRKGRSMETVETDYLVIGSGASGLAFADTLVTETAAHVTIVDRHGKPGGHWNDAYPFVTLHQPSAFYGVNSMQLGTGHIDTEGANKGLHELASGPEVSAYFDAVMRKQLIPSGRVAYYPMSDYRGDGRFVSLLSGRETKVKVRKKVVDTTYIGTAVPSTHAPKFMVGDGVRLIPPNDLHQLWKSAGPTPGAYVIVGAGKTAMDAVTWLLSCGADADAIHWIVPRDSWVLNRRCLQPSMEFFDEVFGGQAAQMQAFAEAISVDDLFVRLETAGVVLRIDTTVMPRMFHYAVLSEGEVEQLRRVRNLIRRGHVKAIEKSGPLFEDGLHALPGDALYINCTACAVDKRPPRPIFEDGLITPQMVRMPQPTFSAALIAFVETHYPSDEEKNRLCRPVSFTHDLADYPSANIGNITNQLGWMQDKKLAAWVRSCRLDGFGKMLAAVDPADVAKTAILGQYRTFTLPALENLHRLAAKN